MKMPPSMEDRLREYYRRLAADPPAQSASEALDRMTRRLDEVEDELSGIPKQAPAPPRELSDGRMYPPQSDSISLLPDGSITARTRGHRIVVGAGGSIVITNLTSGKIEFEKSGAAT